MIKRLEQKLRIAGLEDNLVLELGLRPGTANWLARLATDIATQCGIDLAAMHRPAQLEQFFQLLKRSGYDDLLDAVAADAPLFAARLARAPDGDGGLPRAA